MPRCRSTWLFNLLNVYGVPCNHDAFLGKSSDKGSSIETWKADVPSVNGVLLRDPKNSCLSFNKTFKTNIPLFIFEEYYSYLRSLDVPKIDYSEMSDTTKLRSFLLNVSGERLNEKFLSVMNNINVSPMCHSIPWHPLLNMGYS